MTAPTALTTKTAAGIGAGGTVVTSVACDNTNGNIVSIDANTRLRFNSTPGGTVSFPYPVLVDGKTVPSSTVTVAATGVVYVNPNNVGGGPAGFRTLYPSGSVTFTASASTMFVEVVN